MTHKQTRVAITRPDGVSIMDGLRAGDNGIRTSMGLNYNNAIFGRDSSLVGDILTGVNPHITQSIIMALAKLQGVRFDKASNEEPGRIHHEYRKYRHWETSVVHKSVFRLVGSLWGGDAKHVITYFSMDSTPLYVLMVADYARRKPEILDMVVHRYDRIGVTIRQTVIDAVGWMLRQVSDDGLVEVPRGNFFSLMNQTWKDSPSGYIRPNGETLDITRPVAYLEMQGLVSEALTRAARLLHHEKGVAIWRDTAATMRRATLARFWQEDEQYFASAIQTLKDGDQIVTTIESDPGWLLNTSLFDHLPKAEQAKYVSGIVRRLFSHDFITNAGIRARALRYRKKLALADYHGSYTTWPIDSYMFGRGLRRQNLPLLADQIDARIIDAINKAGNFYEFFFVDANDRVVYDPDAAATPFQRFNGRRVTTLLPAMMPESNIAWTVALGLELRHENVKPRDLRTQEKWQKRLEADILPTIEPFSLKKVLATREQTEPVRPPIVLKNTTGQVAFAMQIANLLANGAAERVVDKLVREIGSVAQRASVK
jgi:glycogen debranching enzyme